MYSSAPLYGPYDQNNSPLSKRYWLPIILKLLILSMEQFKIFEKMDEKLKHNQSNIGNSPPQL